MVLGALRFRICGAFVYIAGRTTTAGNISLIYAAAPIGIAVANSLLLRECPNGLQTIGLGSAFLGILYIISRVNLTALPKVEVVPCDARVLTATAGWVAFTLLQQH